MYDSTNASWYFFVLIRSFFLFSLFRYNECMLFITFEKIKSTKLCVWLYAVFEFHLKFSFFPLFSFAAFLCSHSQCYIAAIDSFVFLWSTYSTVAIKCFFPSPSSWVLSLLIAIVYCIVFYSLTSIEMKCLLNGYSTVEWIWLTSIWKSRPPLLKFMIFAISNTMTPILWDIKKPKEAYVFFFLLQCVAEWVLRMQKLVSFVLR